MRSMLEVSKEDYNNLIDQANALAVAMRKSNIDKDDPIHQSAIELCESLIHIWEKRSE